VLEHIIGRAGTDSNCLVGVSVVGVSVPRAIWPAAVGGPSDCVVLAFRFESLASTTELFFHSTRPVATFVPLSRALQSQVGTLACEPAAVAPAVW